MNEILWILEITIFYQMLPFVVAHFEDTVLVKRLCLQNTSIIGNGIFMIRNVAYPAFTGLCGSACTTKKLLEC